MSCTNKKIVQESVTVSDIIDLFDYRFRYQYLNECLSGNILTEYGKGYLQALDDILESLNIDKPEYIKRLNDIEAKE